MTIVNRILVIYTFWFSCLVQSRWVMLSVSLNTRNSKVQRETEVNLQQRLFSMKYR